MVGGLSALRGLVRRRPWDLTLTVMAAAILAPTLWYRYGLDQSLYHYVGVGWMHGRVPYAQAFDVKPPGIFLTYGLVNVLLGESERSIHIAELACVLIVGWKCAAAAEDGSAGRTDGLAGTVSVLFAAWYATTFGFWDTGQVEFWEAAFLVFAFERLVRPEIRSRDAFAAGVFCAVSVAFKITAAVPVAVLLVFAWRQYRVRKLPMLATSLLTLAGLVTPTLTILLYFCCVRSLSAFLQWLAYLPYYAKEPLDSAWVARIGPEMLLAECGGWFAILGPAVVWGVGTGRSANGESRRWLSPPAWAAVLLIAGAGSIVVQRRYFSYHPVVLGPLLMLSAAYGLGAWIRERMRLVAPALALVCFGTFFSSARWPGNDFMTYRSYVLHAFIPRLRGEASREAFLASFGGPFDYSYVASVGAADLITARRPRPGDGLHVRGYDTTIYTRTHLYSPSRFFMDSPVTNSYLAAFAPEWVPEHDSALEGPSRPRFFVTHRNEPGDILALLRKGYGLVGTRDRYVVLDAELQSERLDEAGIVGRLRDQPLRGTVFGTAPFALEFHDGGAFEGIAGGQAVEGTWNVKAPGTLCLRARSKNWCVSVYESPDGLLAIDQEWRELARVPRKRGTPGSVSIQRLR